MNTIIKGIGAYLPEKEVSSAEMEKMAGYEKFGVKIGLCKMLTSCESRHWSASDEDCSDIAAKAGKAAIENANVTADEVVSLSANDICKRRLQKNRSWKKASGFF